ncbi:MAG: hypothetical protein SVU32_00575, partial [Candidatus Nanohaloarchaea archaeon]|nr:hypothetical protein [Candidatus Nanohaloarchaea archaeon]
ITAIFFLWVSVILVGGVLTVASTDLAMIEALQAMTSSVGTMGPLFISQETLVGLPAMVKMVLAFGMLAGRLEMLPILVMLNVEIMKRLPS